MKEPHLNPFFSIVTPNYNMLGYLKRCYASVADQEDVPFEHIVLDAVSDDGTIEWLHQHKQIISIVEKDKGMYDAINKGFILAKGKIVAYLNCDEQYLQGTLRFVKEYFERHQDIDILFGDTLVIRPDGSLISYRKGFQPRWFYIVASELYLFSCTMFLRRAVLSDGLQFDNCLKAIGDRDFVVRLLRHGYRAAHVRRYLSAFTMTGKNMSIGDNAANERRLALAAAPKWIRLLRYPLNFVRLCEKFISGAYWQKMPLEYSVYNSSDCIERSAFKVWKSSFRWSSE